MGPVPLVFVAVLFYAALSEFTSRIGSGSHMALLAFGLFFRGEKGLFTGLALAALALLI